MFAHHSRKVLFAALLAAAVAAPASASDGIATTTQMTQMGQSAPDVAAMSNAPATAEESSQIETKAPAAMPRAGRKMTELRPTYVAVRQPSASAHYRHAEMPLILGIGH